MKIQLLLVAATSFLFAGCADSSTSVTDNPDSEPVVMEGSPPIVNDSHDGHDHVGDDHPGHGHGDHGPNGGELIELGSEAYHAELVHDKDLVTVYMLDRSAKKVVAVSAQKLVLSLKHEGKVKSFDLEAEAGSVEVGNPSESFTSKDSQLADWLLNGAEGAISIEIEGKSFTGKISHDHDHEGHDHEGHDHDEEHGDGEK